MDILQSDHHTLGCTDDAVGGGIYATEVEFTVPINPNFELDALKVVVECRSNASNINYKLCLKKWDGTYDTDPNKVGSWTGASDHQIFHKITANPTDFVIEEGEAAKFVVKVRLYGGYGLQSPWSWFDTVNVWVAGAISN